MHLEQHGWHSPRVGKWMGIRVYGHYGSPIVVFPTSGGDEREYEGQGMIDALGHHIDSGKDDRFQRLLIVGCGPQGCYNFCST